MGADNYKRIFDAFTERGWVGFEEEFDRIVPRDRPDYADVKRDLLCEPIFDPVAHRRLTETFSGEKTIDEVFDEIRPEGERKAQ